MHADTPFAKPPQSRICAFLIVLGLAGCSTTSGPLQTQLVRQEPVTPATEAVVYDSLCHVNATRRGRFGSHSDWQSSAVLYKGRYLITAAHNLTNAGWTKIGKLEVRCGHRAGRNIPVTEDIPPWGYRVASTYKYRNATNDYGVIRLATTITVDQPFTLSTTDANVGDTIWLAGYPGGRKDTAEPKRDSWTLHSATGAVTEVRGPALRYGILTYTGNSGGPVWRETINGPKLVAIHTNPGRGRLVNADFIAEVEDLIDMLDAAAENQSPGAS